LLGKFAEALLAIPNIHARLRTGPQNRRFKRVPFGAAAFERESPTRLSRVSQLGRQQRLGKSDRFLQASRVPVARCVHILFISSLPRMTFRRMMRPPTTISLLNSDNWNIRT